jgi:hypothetical protein
METVQNETQLQKANKALTELAVNVTTLDRFSAKIKWSEFTIVQYLKGRGTNLDTAVGMLQFFRNKISGREKMIA